MDGRRWTLQLDTLGSRLEDRCTARVNKSTLEGGRRLSTHAMMCRFGQDTRSTTSLTKNIPAILLTIIVFPPELGKDAMSNLTLFRASIIPEVGSLTSSYTGTVLWPVAQFFPEGLAVQFTVDREHGDIFDWYHGLETPESASCAGSPPMWH